MFARNFDRRCPRRVSRYPFVSPGSVKPALRYPPAVVTYQSASPISRISGRVSVCARHRIQCECREKRPENRPEEWRAPDRQFLDGNVWTSTNAAGNVGQSDPGGGKSMLPAPILTGTSTVQSVGRLSYQPTGVRGRFSVANGTPRPTTMHSRCRGRNRPLIGFEPAAFSYCR